MKLNDILDKKAIKNIKEDIKSFAKTSIAIIVMLFLFSKVFGTVCYTQVLFKTPCPFCGITTGLIQLLTFNFKKSFNTNPLSSLVVLNFLVFLFSRYTKHKKLFYILLVISFFIFIFVYLFRYIF